MSLITLGSFCSPYYEFDDPSIPELLKIPPVNTRFQAMIAAISAVNHANRVFINQNGIYTVADSTGSISIKSLSTYQSEVSSFITDNTLKSAISDVISNDDPYSINEVDSGKGTLVIFAKPNDANTDQLNTEIKSGITRTINDSTLKKNATVKIALKDWLTPLGAVKKLDDMFNTNSLVGYFTMANLSNMTDAEKRTALNNNRSSATLAWADSAIVSTNTDTFASAEIVSSNRLQGACNNSTTLNKSVCLYDQTTFAATGNEWIEYISQCAKNVQATNESECAGTFDGVWYSDTGVCSDFVKSTYSFSNVESSTESGGTWKTDTKIPKSRRTCIKQGKTFNRKPAVFNEGEFLDNASAASVINSVGISQATAITALGIPKSFSDVSLFVIAGSPNISGLYNGSFTVKILSVNGVIATHSVELEDFSFAIDEVILYSEDASGNGVATKSNRVNYSGKVTIDNQKYDISETKFFKKQEPFQ